MMPPTNSRVETSPYWLTVGNLEYRVEERVSHHRPHDAVVSAISHGQDHRRKGTIDFPPQPLLRAAQGTRARRCLIGRSRTLDRLSSPDLRAPVSDVLDELIHQILVWPACDGGVVKEPRPMHGALFVCRRILSHEHQLGTLRASALPRRKEHILLSLTSATGKLLSGIVSELHRHRLARW